MQIFMIGNANCESNDRGSLDVAVRSSAANANRASSDWPLLFSRYAEVMRIIKSFLRDHVIHLITIRHHPCHASTLSG